MMKKYLKPNIVIEPLVCSLYLWSYLLPPHTLGLFLKNRYLPGLRSFINFPELHTAAATDATLLGGQFLDVSVDKFTVIHTLITAIETQAAELLDLAADIEALDEKLQLEGTGHSLEHLYEMLPDRLRGCVEFVYDHNNHPKLRFFDKILYDKFQFSHLQSVLLSPLNTDKRKFVLSTPRIAEPNELQLTIGLKSGLLSDICRSRVEGIDYVTLEKQLDLPENKSKVLASFFNDEPPMLKNCRHYQGEGVRVRYFGHACILLQTRDVSILVDPLISYFQPENGIERYSLDDLPDVIHYVVFTHNHLDHIAFETLIFLKGRVKQYVFPRSSGGTVLDPCLKLMLIEQGFEGLIPLDKMEGISCKDGVIYSFPFLGEHGDLDIQAKSAFYIQLKGYKFLFAADSNNLDPGLYEYLHQKVGTLDALFLGMECVGAPVDWIYGPLLSRKLKSKHKQSRRYSGSDSKRATSLIHALKSKQVYIYAMGQEAWLSHIMSLDYAMEPPQIIESNKFIADCHDIGQNAVRLFGKFESIYKGEI